MQYAYADPYYINILREWICKANTLTNSVSIALIILYDRTNKLTLTFPLKKCAGALCIPSYLYIG